VAAALAVLLVFPLYFLRSFAYAGIGVVVIAMVSALFVLPALLAVLGPRIDRGRLPWARNRPVVSESTFWRRVAAAVTRRPVLAALPVVALLLLAAAPLLKVEFGTPDDRVLTTASDSRVVGDAMIVNHERNPTAIGRRADELPRVRRELGIAWAALLLALLATLSLSEQDKGKPNPKGNPAPEELTGPKVGEKAPSFTLDVNGKPSYIRGQNAVPLFDDTKKYWYEEQPNAGVTLPQTGTTIKVLSENGTSMKVRIGKK